MAQPAAMKRFTYEMDDFQPIFGNLGQFYPFYELKSIVKNF
jgi:hypothetical protein